MPCRPNRRSRSLTISFSALSFVPLLLLLCSCGSTQQPYHGFPDQSSLDTKDAYVIRESVGGALDPTRLAQDGQAYAHHNIAYNQIEEGYYRWGQQLYGLGYRDGYYVRDLAPRAFKHELLDTYDHAIATGFEDASKQSTPAN
ncbi:MAG: hypothetical protein Q8922_02530 [Bacteroidota bacterium]|nr:hypothetical protein [Bacteroidota bacterium]MDP4232248.1 hypothetical protein [Bacteroidota bacterium]MDP4242650.1 hypothetical protein [Bacteroidota bacterium]MDP4286788.1 hypothetical protein [Bacteroidota bacterium]